MSPRIFISRDSGALCVGAEDVAHSFRKAFDRRGLDVDIVRTGSRGMYWLEPLVEVATDKGRVGYGPVSVSEVDALLDAGMLEGKSHKLGIGVVEEFPWLKSQTRLTFKNCGIIDPRSLEAYKGHGGYAGLKKALAVGPKAIVEEVITSGLRGRGGAGFPTGIKWRTVAETPPQQKYIACNADEGDSGSFADRMIMEGDPFVLIEGMTIAGIAVGSTFGYIYIRAEYPHSIEAMEIAIREARKGGMLGRGIAGSSFDFDMEVRAGAGAYVCGEETSMLESLEGKRGEVRAKPPLPAHVGLFGRPTVINNVLSLASVPSSWSAAAASTATSAWASRAAPCRSSLPAISSMAGFTRRRSVLRSAGWLTRSAGVRARGARSAPCRSAGRSGPTSRANCSIHPSIMRPSPPATV
jgi:formate dehydrogenase iron-sulfur subunit